MFSLTNVVYQNILRIPKLNIPAGQVTCLFGPSGCGKSTLLRMLNGMISPDMGTLTYNNDDMASLDLVNHRRNVLMLPQQTWIFPGSVRDNLNAGFTLQELPPPEDALLLSLLKQVCLEEKGLDENPELFSGGEKQRLALARVLLLSPEVLLLDEPGSALDAASEDAVMEAIRADQRRRGSSCVLVTHSAAAAEAYADTIVYMEKGTVTAVKTNENKKGDLL